MTDAAIWRSSMDIVATIVIFSVFAFFLWLLFKEIFYEQGKSKGLVP